MTRDTVRHTQRWDQLDSAVPGVLRSALARAHLAASELDREVATPRARRLVERVLAATRAIDAAIPEQIGDRCEGRSAARGAGVDPVLAAARLHERLAPALAARGIHWRLSVGQSNGAPRSERRVDPSVLREAVCNGIECMTREVEAPVAIELVLRQEMSDCVLGLRPEMPVDGEAAELTIRVPWEEAPCTAS